MMVRAGLLMVLACTARAMKRSHDYSCIKRGKDYGQAATSVNGACTSAKILVVYTNNPKYVKKSWMPAVTQDTKIKTMIDCQKYCAANKDCFAFAYEWQKGFHVCFLKKEIERPDICPEYQTWTNTNNDPAWFGASGPTKCEVPPRCFKHDFDYGRKNDVCDYASMVKVIANHANYSFPGYAPATQVDTDLNSYFDCQSHCQKTAACDYFSYEYEYNEDGNRYHECFLKKEQVVMKSGNRQLSLEDTVDNNRQLSVEDFGMGKSCPQYTIWPFEDPHWRGTSGPKSCPLPSTCIKVDFDYGRKSSDTCGHATVLKVIANHANYSFPKWHTDAGGATAIDAGLENMHDCQVLCQKTVGCDFFAYEYELDEGDGDSYHECYLKKKVKDNCQEYAVWPFGDTNWRGASGPKFCPVPTSCVKPEFDYGRKTSDMCDFADTVKVVANSPRYMVPSWYKGPKAVDAKLNSAFYCQSLCKANADCKFFSHEFEEGFHECFMKKPIANPNNNCSEYSLWPFDDYNWQGFSGPEECPLPSTCFKPDFDYGRKTSDACGFAKTVKIVANSPAYDIPSWARGNVATLLDSQLNTPEDCQAHCEKEPQCKYFSYEYEAEYVGGKFFHECFLKAEIKDPENCVSYALWPFDDPAWKGVSGPKSCTTNAVASDVSAGVSVDVKAFLMLIPLMVTQIGH